MNTRRRAPSHKIKLGALVTQVTSEQWTRLHEVIRAEASAHWGSMYDYKVRTAEAYLRDITVILNTRMGSYGWAHYATKTIELAEHIRNDKAEWTDTLLHEVAHHLNHIIHGCDGHGKNWKRIAAAVGAQPVRCGPVLSPEARAQIKVVEYTCTDCGHVYTRSRRWPTARYHTACKHKPGRGLLKLTKHPHLAELRRNGEA